MTLFIIFISLLVIGATMMFISVFHGIDTDGNFVSESRAWLFSIGLSSVFIGLILAIIFATCAIGANSKRFNTDKKNEYVEKRKTLVAELKNCSQDNVIEVYDSVREYNINIINGRTWNNRPITKWITYDIWDELELIDLNDFAKNPYAVEFTVGKTENNN
jgi:hypothetical protein